MSNVVRVVSLAVVLIILGHASTTSAGFLWETRDQKLKHQQTRPNNAG